MAAASHSLPRERALVLPRPWIHRRTCARPGIPRGSRCPQNQPRMPRVWASRPNCFSPCAGPPPRPLNRSRRTAGREVEVLRQLGKRVGGLRCSRVHPGVCAVVLAADTRTCRSGLHPDSDPHAASIDVQFRPGRLWSDQDGVSQPTTQRPRTAVVLDPGRRSRAELADAPELGILALGGTGRARWGWGGAPRW